MLPLLQDIQKVMINSNVDRSTDDVSGTDCNNFLVRVDVIPLMQFKVNADGFFKYLNYVFSNLAHAL